MTNSQTLTPDNPQQIRLSESSQFKANVYGSRSWTVRFYMAGWMWLATWTLKCYSGAKHWFLNRWLIIWFNIHFPGWQAGVVAAIAIGLFSMSLNIAFLIIAKKKQSPASNGLGTMFEGDCHTIGKRNQVAHALINVLSTCLVGLSNYCMQLLASPTRKSVDEAHKRRDWVEIGIQSFRNVWKRHISPWHATLWIVLGISSAPLHLLWNSVIIFTPSAYQYHTLIVTEGFARGLPFNEDVLIQLSDADSPHQPNYWPDNLNILQRDLINYEKLDPLACKTAYAKNFVRDRADVIVVMQPKTSEFNSSLVLGATTGGWGHWPYKWMCPTDLTQNFKCYGQLFKSAKGWNFPQYEDYSGNVDHCLSKRMDERCKLEYAFYVTVLVIAANFLKVCCFACTYFIIKQHTKNDKDARVDMYENMLLITTGDAIASFLEVPDQETKGMSIVEKEDFENGIWSLRWISINPIVWRKRCRCANFRAIGLLRWSFGSILLGIIPLAPGLFLLTQLDWLKDTLQLNNQAIRQLGMGSPSALFLFGTWSGGDTLSRTDVLRNVTYANIPQLIVSIAYFFWNGQLTTIVAAREYDTYAAPIRNDEATEVGRNKQKRGLRVTYPTKGSEQEATHFLTVPIKYWVPNTLIWTSMHYFASQSVFFARVQVLNRWLEVTRWSISQVGYSVLGLLCFCANAFVALLLGISIGVGRLANQMPLAATCSGALSAACHPHNRSIRHHENKIHWGVEIVQNNEADVMSSGVEIACCTFTSEEAYYPLDSMRYA